MYYRLDVDLVGQNVYIEEASNKFVSLISGSRLPENTPTPFRYTMEVDADEEGQETDPLMYAFFPESCLMQRPFLRALRGAGVDNIQSFPAIITDRRSKRRIDDYETANVVGLVSCARVEESRTSPLADVYYFHDLVIDPSRTGALRLFRLAESQMEIIVDEKVAEAIRNGDFAGVVLEPLRES